MTISQSSSNASGTVLVTGGTGFLGSHIIQQLLDNGYSVLAVARSPEKAQFLSVNFQNRISTTIIPDITVPGAFDPTLQTQTQPPITSIIHAASPFYFNHSNAETEILDPAIKGTLELLRSAHRCTTEPNSTSPLKHIILTSSFAAAMSDPAAKQENTNKHIYNEDHWNPVTYEQAAKTPMLTYIGSKTLSEKRAWEYMSENKDEIQFDLTTLLPVYIFGPPLLLGGGGSNDENGGLEVNTSNQTINELVQGKHKDAVPPLLIPAYVDVRDAAAAHVRALQTPEARGERFMLSSETYTMEKVVKIMRRRFAELRERLPPLPGRCLDHDHDRDHDQAKGEGKDGEEMQVDVDGGKTERVLGIRYRGLDETLVATVGELMRRNGMVN